MNTMRLRPSVLALTFVSAAVLLARPASAQTFAAAMSGATEFPAGSGSPDGSGLAAITVKGTTITFSISVKGISTPTLAHIHKAPLGASGPVVIDFHAPVFTSGFTSGSTTGAADVVADLLANPSSYYVNVHTAEYPAGALRGQLGPAPLPAATFVTALAGTGEAPAAGSPDGGGVAQVTISGTTVFYTLIVQGLASTPTAAHIHRGLLGASGPVVVPFPAPFVSGVSSGTTTVSAPLAAEILANPSGFYVNVHTAEFPGGAVRGVLSAAGPATVYVPTVVKAPGINGTSFVSDLRIVNTTATAAQVTVDYFPTSGGAAGSAATMNLNVPAGAQAVYNDVLGSQFSTSGLGSLRLTSNVPVVVESRVLNDQRPVDGGTNGLLVPPSTLSDAPTNGTLALLSNASPADLAAKLGFRTNLGYFNPTANSVKATFKALRNDGSTIGTATLTIAGYARAQQAAFDLIPPTVLGDTTQTDFYVTYSADGPLFVYGTVVDNRTGDGIYTTGAFPR